MTQFGQQWQEMAELARKVAVNDEKAQWIDLIRDYVWTAEVVPRGNASRDDVSGT
ncbi:hypothetical protein [Sulfurisoma sediminicola]|uniref:hypothetical protein n=1 Tax=Sulfurisoma sediminicola TaxID=1381557 RepID=UPI001404FDAE|nr:hypothetical protein [Sulfurisoma sediminicola]